ncbi:MAG TPA: Ltp family lipoprotein [Streptosporangiaceae bacterium]|nr:Ltp family lipoprotein [Streptosporangiaceae bacterium]
MSYQGNYGDGWPPQYLQSDGRQYPQDEPRQPQEYDPFAHNQNPGGRQGTGSQQYPQQIPPWNGAPGSQQQPNGQPWPPQNHQFPPQVPPGQHPPFMPPHHHPKRKSWPARHKVLTGLMAVGALIVIIAAASASNKPSAPAADTGAASSSASPSAAVSSAAASAPPSTPAAPASPSMTDAQQQAVDAAQDYLGVGQGFSRQGLLDQLTSSAGNGFSKPDAEFAIHYLSPNWDQQAADAAQGYLSVGQGFSEQGLLQQLTSSAGSGFTQAQAEYAINHSHPDWDAQAVDAAKGYMQMGGFSRASLIEQLTSSAGNGFTQAQAEYAASKVGL